MFGLVVAWAIVLVGGGYVLCSWYAAPPPAELRLDMNRIGGSAQSSAQESPAYRELLREHNARGAKEPQHHNVSFIASIPLQQDVIVPPAHHAGQRHRTDHPAGRQPGSGTDAGA